MAAVMTITSRTPYRGVPDTALRAGPTTRPRRRVTRAAYVRRRLSVAVMAVAVVLVTAQAGAALGDSSPDVPGRAPAFARTGDDGGGTATDSLRGGTATVVRPGDSLWSVAERLAPGADPRPVVDALRDARDGDPLLVGETVRWAG